MAKKPFGHIKKGAMHRDLGLKPDAKITEADIARERKINPKRAQFAENARHFHHAGARGHMARHAQKVLK